MLWYLNFLFEMLKIKKSSLFLISDFLVFSVLYNFSGPLPLVFISLFQMSHADQMPDWFTGPSPLGPRLFLTT